MPWRTEPEGKEVVWNGMRMLVPAGWHPAIVLDSSLVFEKDYSPVLAIKWQELKRATALEDLFPSLQKSSSGCRFLPSDLPLDWKKALLRFAPKGFTWEHHHNRGNGALLLCQESSRVIVLQTYSHQDSTSRPILDFLHSLEDHSPQPAWDWAIFDIKARLPREAALSFHEFLPGRFTLTFAHGSDRCSLLRFKPAATLLKRHSLQDFGTQLAGSTALLPSNAPHCADWILAPGSTSRIRAFFRRKPEITRLGLRHIEECNAILGVRTEGRRPMEQSLYDDIVAHFTIVQ